MSGYPQGSVVSNWGQYIAEQYRPDVELFWDRVYSSDAATQSAEWQFTNGKWGELD